jgi:hypothetical protein
VSSENNGRQRTPKPRLRGKTNAQKGTPDYLRIGADFFVSRLFRPSMIFETPAASVFRHFGARC